MTITVITCEGTRITGSSALDVVRQLNERALIGEPDAWRYMVTLAARVRRLCGAVIRTSSPGTFLADMAAAGYVALEEAPEARP